MRIRTQLIVALSLSMLVCVGMAITVVERIKSQAELLIAFDRSQATAQACASLLSLTQEFAFYGEQRAAQQWRKQYAEIKKNATAEVVRAQFHSQDLNALNANIDHLAQLFIALETISTAPVTALTPMRKQLIVDQLVTNTTNVADDAYQLATEVNEARKLSNERFITTYIATALAFIIIIGYFATLIITRILRPLARLEAAAAAVRLGDLSVKNRSLAQDELGELGREFDEMTSSLQNRNQRLLVANTDLAQQVELRAQTEQRIRLITDNLPVLIAYISTDGIYTFVNRQFDRILGLDSANMVGRPVREVLGEKNFERLRPQATKVFAGKPVSFDVRLETATAERDFRANYIPDLDSQGRVVGFFVMHEDITDRKIIDAQLRSLNNRFLLAAKAGGIGVWEWNVAANRIIADARMYQMYQLEDNATTKTLDAWGDRIHPQDIDRVTRAIGAAIKGEAAYDTEFRIVLPDHSIRTIKANGSLFGSRDDGSLSMIGVNWDASALRGAERAQYESEERFRLFVEHVEDYSIIMLDANGIVESWNIAAEHMQGYQANEIIGAHLSIFYPPESIAVDHPTQTLLAAEQSGSFQEEGWRLRKDGARFLGEVTITALRDQAGSLRGFGMVTRDLTDQKQKEAAISQALIEKETLLKEVYHRVKNNLQVITSLLNLQARTVGAGAAFDALTESVGRVRAMSLVHEKLYQSGTLSSIPVRDYIVDLCRDLAMTTGASQRGVVISCEIAPIELGLETAVPLGLLLNELVSNCLKHAFPDDRKGMVKIVLTTDDSTHILLQVTDNGVGMAAGFDIMQSPSLGLKLATTLTSQLDGELGIVSENGMTVTVSFPIPVSVQHR